jgi:hypothetical protein
LPEIHKNKSYSTFEYTKGKEIMEQIINSGASTLNIETQFKDYNKNIEDLKNKVQEL